MSFWSEAQWDYTIPTKIDEFAVDISDPISKMYVNMSHTKIDVNSVDFCPTITFIETDTKDLITSLIVEK